MTDSQVDARTLINKHCDFCGAGNVDLTQEMIRTNFAFGKKFPAEYEKVMLCDQCLQVVAAKNKRAKIGAIIALTIIFAFMGIKFAILYSPIIF